jgi:hypothetical protein
VCVRERERETDRERERGKTHTGHWLGNLNERDHWEDLNVDGIAVLNSLYTQKQHS